MGRVEPSRGGRLNWLARLWWWLADLLGWHGGLRTEVVQNFPDAFDPSRVYLVGEGETPWSAALLCPCGCGAEIQVSLVENDRPRWRVKRHFNGTVTLHPSIWRKKGCRSHFFLRRGRIVWADRLQIPSHAPDNNERRFISSPQDPTFPRGPLGS